MMDDKNMYKRNKFVFFAPRKTKEKRNRGKKNNAPTTETDHPDSLQNTILLPLRIGDGFPARPRFPGISPWTMSRFDLWRIDVDKRCILGRF